jgi:ABC-type branched-subunit amino acid transport system ATPase component
MLLEIISVKDILVYYGKSVVLNGVSLEIVEGSIISIIGPM